MKNIELTKYPTFEETLKKYNRYIKVICNKYNIDKNKDLFDELYQEASIALYKAYINYDSDSIYTFHNYAVTCILNSLKNFINKNTSTVRRPIKLIKEHTNINIISINTPLGDDTNSTIEDTLEDIQEDLSIDDQEKAQRAVLMNYLHKLKESHQEIIKMYVIEEMTYEEIGEALGTTRQNISQIYKVAINKLKKFYLNNNNNKK